MSTFNLQSVFPELYTVDKILVTLPIGSTKCERTFSELKFVKNNLRSTMGQKRLNPLMLINVERDLTKILDYEQVIKLICGHAAVAKYVAILNLLYCSKIYIDWDIKS